MRKYRQYTDNDIRSAVETSTSIAQVLRKLNLREVGGNYATVKKKISHLGIPTDHFTGQAHNKNKEIKLFDALKSKPAIKRRLLKERGHACEFCGISEWNNLPIVLEMDHIDGNSFNNSRENLRILCPNCHSQTPTFRNNKR
jgi:hypothetical protein